MKWFLIVLFVHISEYDLPRPNDTKLWKEGKGHDSYQECLLSASPIIIEKIKNYEFMYDWKIALCTDSQMSVYIHPTRKLTEGKGLIVNYKE